VLHVEPRHAPQKVLFHVARGGNHPFLRSLAEERFRIFDPVAPRRRRHFGSGGDERVNRRSRAKVGLEAPKEQAQSLARKIVEIVPGENQIEMSARLGANEIGERFASRRGEIRDGETRATTEEEIQVRRARRTQVEDREALRG
jgi:hypothetical protein